MSDVGHLSETEEWSEKTKYLNQFPRLVDSIYQAREEPLSKAVLLKDVEI